MAEADLMPITKILITFYKHNLCQEGYIYCPWPTYTILTIVQPSLQESQGKQPRIPQSSLEASATSQTCHSPEF